MCDPTAVQKRKKMEIYEFGKLLKNVVTIHFSPIYK